MEDRRPEPRDLAPDTLLEHLQWMRALARGLVLEGESVDDLVQDAWAAALARPPREGVPLNAWLAGVLRRRAAFLRRSRGRERAREERVARPEAVPSGDELLARTEQQQLLLEELAALPEAYRHVLQLRYEEGLAPTRIAAHLGLPVNTVRTRLQRGLERLRGRLDARHGGDRRAWSLALLPLATTDPRTAAAGVASTATTLKTLTLGALVHVWKPALLALSVLVPLALLRRPAAPPLPDLSRTSAPADVALELAAARAELARPATPEASTVRREVPSPSTRRLRGRVVDLAGRPISGARISRTSPPRAGVVRPVQRHLHFSGWCTSDGSGAFEAELAADEPWPWLEVLHEDHLAVAAAYPVDAEGEALLTMAPLHTVRLAVRVQDRLGRAVPRYRLMVSIPLAGGGEARTQLWTAHSAEQLDGPAQIEVPWAEDRPLHLLVDTLGLDPDVPRGDLRRVVQPDPAGTTEVLFEFDLDAAERAAALLATGTVLDARSGEPVPGAEVFLHPRTAPGRFGVEERRVQTFDDGTFRIGAAAGGPDALVRVHHPHYRVGQVHFDGTTPVELRLEPRPVLSGVVLDRSGSPLPDAHLLLARELPRERLVTFDSPETRWRVRSDEAGRFTFGPLEEDRYALALVHGPRASDDDALLRRTVVLRGSEQRELTLRLDAPDRVELRGRVLPPVPDAPALVPVLLPHAPEGGWVLARPAPGGRFVAGGVERGTYSVLLLPASDDHDGPMALLPTLEVRGVGLAELELRFPAGVLEGRLLHDRPADLRVVALPDAAAGFAREVLESPDMLARLARPLTGDGTWRLEHLAAGTHTVLVLGPDGEVLGRLTVDHGGGHEVLPPRRL